MDKRLEGKDRHEEGGPQDGPLAQGIDPVGGDRAPAGAETRDEIGVGGQRHNSGSSRDPDAQGRRTKDEAHG
jgi:hypothetical protein